MSAWAPLLVSLTYDGLTYDRVRVHGAGGQLQDTRENAERLRAWLQDPSRHPVVTIYVDDVQVKLDSDRVRLLAIHSGHDVPEGGLFDRLGGAQKGEVLEDAPQAQRGELAVLRGPARLGAVVDPRDLSRREGR